MWRFFKPVAIKGVQTLLRTVSEAIKEGATVKDVIKSTVQPTFGAVLGVTVDQDASKLIDMRDKHAAAPPLNPPMVLPETVQAGSGTIQHRHVHLYISRRQNWSSIHLTSGHLFIIFEMGTMGIEPTEQIANEVDLFGTIMQQNIIENEFNREYAPLATIQHNAPIEFMVKNAKDLYLDLNNSRMHVLAKITKADGANIDANTASPINLPLHPMFKEIAVELNCRDVGDTSQLYAFRAYIETALNFSKETQETRLQCEGSTKDTTGHMGVTSVGGNNAGLNARA